MRLSFVMIVNADEFFFLDPICVPGGCTPSMMVRTRYSRIDRFPSFEECCQEGDRPVIFINILSSFLCRRMVTAIFHASGVVAVSHIRL